MTHALLRFCCFTWVGIQFGVTVTLATATLDVLTLAFLKCEENTCYSSAHHTEKHTEMVPPPIGHSSLAVLVGSQLRQGVDLEVDGDDLELLSELVQDHLNEDGWAQN